MKQIISFLFIGYLSGFSFITSTFAQESFEIENFHANIELHEDSSLMVTEEIKVKFSEPRHGLLRDIDNQGIQLQILEVTNAENQTQPYEVSDFGGYTEVKIGDPDSYVNGEQIYKIRYKVLNAIRQYESPGVLRGAEVYDELYWNVTGNQWPVSIAQASATVQLPSSLFSKGDELAYQCFTGAYGSSTQDCGYESAVEGKIQFKSNVSLLNNEGLTVVVAMPSGRLEIPQSLWVQTVPQRATVLVNDQLQCLSDCEVFLASNQRLSAEKWGYEPLIISEDDQKKLMQEIPMELQPTLWLMLLRGFSIVLFFIIVANPIYLFLKKGRDPKGRGVIIPQYEAPDKMIPAEMGTLYDEKVHLHDLTSTIINLCVRGYMKIKVLPKAKGLLFKEDDYELIKTNQSKLGDKGLSEFEKTFMEAIFESQENRKLSDLEEKFYTHLPKLKNMLYQNMVSKEYMPQSASQVRSRYFVKAFLLFFLSILGSSLLAAFQLDPFFYSLSSALGINAILTLILAFFMPHKTKKGRLAYEHILGFKLYLETAEKERVKFEEKENLFFKFLPYAMTLGIAEKWSKAFEGIYKNPPEWYEGGQTGRFSPIYFSHHLDDLTRQMGKTFTSSPHNSGSGSHSGGSGFSGGFSGGGFGGGGGGSW